MKRRRVDVATIALRQIERAAEWWRRNRDKNSDLFDQQILAALASLEVGAELHARVASRKGEVRRMVLERIHYLMFFEVRDDVVIILRVRRERRRPTKL